MDNNIKDRFIDPGPMDLTDEDVLKAMKDIPGYLDITPGDFKEIYSFAYRHAVERHIHSTRAKDAMTRQVVFVNKATTLIEVAGILNHHEITGVPVVDDENNFYGVIFINDIRNIIFNTEMWDTTFIKDLMYMPESLVNPDDSMESVAQKFHSSEHFNIPVIKDGKYLGFVSRAQLFSTYRRLLKEFSDE